MTDENTEISPASPDFQTELAEKLAELCPEAVADGKIDVKKLEELLSSDAATGTERFGLFWPGKRQALRVAQIPTTATLKPCPDLSVNWDTTENVFIEGENLEVLKVLQRSYHGKIKMIYIDPPYNTGKDFVYKDNFHDSIQQYLKYSNQVDEDGNVYSTNATTDGRYHSKWLNMMYPRLKLARNLLADDGLVFISIGDDEYDNLKKIVNELYGETNYISTLIWDTNNSAQAGIFKTYHQYILVYAKNSTLIKTPKSANSDEFEDRAQKRPSKRHPLSTFTFPAGVRWEAQDGTELCGIWGGAEESRLISGRMICRENKTAEEVTIEAGWTQKDQMQDYFYGDKNNLVDSRGQKVSEFYFSSSGKIMIKKVRGIDTPSTVRREYGSQSVISSKLAELFNASESPFDSPKPVEMIKEFINWFTDLDDIILDFFSGSGTTGHAIFELNFEMKSSRKFILVQLPEFTKLDSAAYKAGYLKISDLSMERIKRAGNKIASNLESSFNIDNFSLDYGFRTYKLVDTNFRKWNVKGSITQEKLQTDLLAETGSSNDNAEPLELLTELLLKDGISLTEKIEEVEIGGLKVFRVGDHNEILAYMDEHTKPTLEQLQKVVDEKPARLIILEDAFHGDDELKTNLVQMCKRDEDKGSHIELRTA